MVDFGSAEHVNFTCHQLIELLERHHHTGHPFPPIMVLYRDAEQLAYIAAAIPAPLTVESFQESVKQFLSIIPVADPDEVIIALDSWCSFATTDADDRFTAATVVRVPLPPGPDPDVWVLPYVTDAADNIYWVGSPLATLPAHSPMEAVVHLIHSFDNMDLPVDMTLPQFARQLRTYGHHIEL